MLTIIDMGISNLRSVQHAFERIGAPVTVTDDPTEVAQAAALILPGVGAFGDGMESLAAKNLIGAIRAHAAQDKPLFGICLGMQLLADSSQEHGNHQGLGLVSGQVVRLQPTEAGYRVPNMGWCLVRPLQDSPLFHTLSAEASFYFAHSYHLRCSDPADVAAVIDYSGQAITAAIVRGPIWGVQFHPEKSQDAGLELLATFVRQVK